MIDAFIIAELEQQERARREEPPRLQIEIEPPQQPVPVDPAPETAEEEPIRIELSLGGLG